MLAKNQAIGWPLLGFNIGLEAGQIAVVTFILLISYFRVLPNNIKLAVFGIIIILSCFTISNRSF